MHDEPPEKLDDNIETSPEKDGTLHVEWASRLEHPESAFWHSLRDLAMRSVRFWKRH